MSARLRAWLKFAIALSFSVFFSYLFLRSTDLGEVGDALAGADYLYVVPALGLFALSLAVRALRWQYMYRPGRDLDWRRLLPSLLVGYAGNNLLPLRAGELLRAQHVADRARVPRMQTFGTFMMERLFDGLVLATFLLWGLLLADEGGAYLDIALLLAGGTAVGFLIGAYLAKNPRLPARLVSRPLPLLSERIRGEIATLGESFLSGFSTLTSLSRFSAVLLTSACAWGLEIGMYFIISRAFSLDASFLTIAFAGSAANVAMSVPSAQGGVGPFQYFAKEALLKFSIAGDAAAAYAVALHLFLVGPVSLVGLLIIWRSTVPTAEPAPAVVTTPVEAIE